MLSSSVGLWEVWGFPTCVVQNCCCWFGWLRQPELWWHYASWGWAESDSLACMLSLFTSRRQRIACNPHGTSTPPRIWKLPGCDNHASETLKSTAAGIKALPYARLLPLPCQFVFGWWHTPAIFNNFSSSLRICLRPLTSPCFFPHQPLNRTSRRHHSNQRWAL